MPITISKEHEGKAVYGLGWGNNCPRGGRPNIPVHFFVEKVNRKYVKLKTNFSHIAVNYHPEKGVTQNSINAGYGCNEGYSFFESLQDIEDYKALNKIKADVMGYFRGHNAELSEGQARTIHAILFPSQTAESNHPHKTDK